MIPGHAQPLLMRFAVLAALILPSAGSASPHALPAEDTSVDPAAVHAALPAVGSPAPDLVWGVTPYGWRRLRDLCAEGAQLIVIAPTTAQLAALERESAALSARGASLIVVLQQSADENWETIQRLGLHCRLLSDPRGEVADSLGVLDAGTGRARPAWFLVDRAGTIRACAVDAIPVGDLVAAVAAALPTPAMATDDAR